MNKEILEQLKNELIYDPDNGVFWWALPKQGRKDEAGTYNYYGYKVITFNNRKYPCTKIAWYFMTGDWPDQPIGFKDNNSKNLQWSNLKLTTKQELLEQFKIKKNKLEAVNIRTTKPIRRASFSNQAVHAAQEEFIKGKTLFNGRYQSNQDSSN